MAPLSLHTLSFASLCFLSLVSAQIDSQLVGTWSTKSAKVLTGPGFYNPINDTLIEPRLTGISYSFTADGFYEEAYYRAVSNPTTPNCPQAIMQFQHGTVVQNADLSLSLTPFAVDGRQLQSNPCSTTKKAVYTRYNQSETMSKWQVYEDPYTKLTRLDLYGVDGTPMNPMFLAYRPPQMLPTVTMNPTSGAASATATGSASSTGKVKRGLAEEMAEPLNRNAPHIKRKEMGLPLLARVEPSVILWTGLAMIVFGTIAYRM